MPPKRKIPKTKKPTAEPEYRPLPKTYLQPFFNGDEKTGPYQIQRTAKNGDCSFDTIRLAKGWTELSNEDLRWIFAKHYIQSSFHQSTASSQFKPLMEQVEAGLPKAFEHDCTELRCIQELIMEKKGDGTSAYYLSTEDIEKLGTLWNFAPVFINQRYGSKKKGEKGEADEAQPLLFPAPLDTRLPIILFYVRSLRERHYELIVTRTPDAKTVETVTRTHKFEELPNDLQTALRAGCFEIIESGDEKVATNTSAGAFESDDSETEDEQFMTPREYLATLREKLDTKDPVQKLADAKSQFDRLSARDQHLYNVVLNRYISSRPTSPRTTGSSSSCVTTQEYPANLVDDLSNQVRENTALCHEVVTAMSGGC
jgi:hypothetical protein